MVELGGEGADPGGDRPQLYDQVIHLGGRNMRLHHVPARPAFAVVEAEDLAVVTGRTRYLDPPTSYRNLFIIRFDDSGRCYDFTEWWIEEAD